MPHIPPPGEGQVQQKQDPQHAERAHPPSDQKRDSDQQFDHSNCIPESGCMRQDDSRQKRTIEADGGTADVVMQIILKSAMGEAGSGDLVFAEQQKEDGRCDPGGGNRP